MLEKLWQLSLMNYAQSGQNVRQLQTYLFLTFIEFSLCLPPLADLLRDDALQVKKRAIIAATNLFKPALTLM